VIYPASATSGIAWSDYGRCHTERHPSRTKQLDYTWAFSDAQVRRVVAARIARIAYASKLPESIDELRALDTVALAMLDKNKSKETSKAAAAARRAGGLAAYYTALIYRSVRLGEDSVHVATEFGVMPSTVRRALHVMNQDAAQLAAGTFKLYARCPSLRKYAHKSGPKFTWDFENGKEMRRAGFSYREIAVKFGVCEQTVHAALLRVGVVYPRARRARWRGHKFNYYEAAAMRREGMSDTKIAEALGVDSSSVWYALNESPALKPIVTVQAK